MKSVEERGELMITVVVGDSQKIMCEGVKLILEKDSEIAVIGQSTHLQGTLLLVSELQPDVVLMDLGISDSSGIEGIKRLKKDGRTKVIVFTVDQDERHIVHALLNGADGYLLKDMNPDELILSIKSVAIGLSTLNKLALISLLKHTNASGVSPEQLRMSERELDIVRYVVEGLENREIARSLYISEGTVKNTISSILKRLNLKTRTQLVAYSIKNNLVNY
jgi:DNA-binding NarL/FixJ family response regulator